MLGLAGTALSGTSQLPRRIAAEACGAARYSIGASLGIGMMWVLANAALGRPGDPLVDAALAYLRDGRCVSVGGTSAGD